MKKVFVVSGGVIAGYSLYKLGKLVGEFKIVKKAVDYCDEMTPGTKEKLVRNIADTVFDRMFHKDEETKSEE